jgi:hypothetical protein
LGGESSKENDMQKMLMAAGVVAAVAMAGSGVAQAQAADHCKGRVFVDTVYQTGTGGQNYEYYVTIRNGTSAPLKWQLSFSGMPGNVSLFSPVLPGGSLAAGRNETIKFGKGTTGNINLGTVKVQYDSAAPKAGMALVSLTNCRG